MFNHFVLVSAEFNLTEMFLIVFVLFNDNTEYSFINKTALK